MLWMKRRGKSLSAFRVTENVQRDVSKETIREGSSLYRTSLCHIIMHTSGIEGLYPTTPRHKGWNLLPAKGDSLWWKWLTTEVGHKPLIWANWGFGLHCTVCYSGNYQATSSSLSYLAPGNFCISLCSQNGSRLRRMTEATTWTQISPVESIGMYVHRSKHRIRFFSKVE